ncbi:MAG: thiamine phosphate synthase [Armatimonadota bacterium]|nr:MAG: thiamine phosphate synthase [Armatimonadota bacterium]
MYGLYVITERWQGRSHADVARAALAGGAKTIQLRDKGMAVRELFATARELREMCEQAGALFIVNDRLDVALAAQAHGVHLGDEDLPVADARRALAGWERRRFIIGASAATVKEAQQAVADGADYLGVGAMFATDTKPDAGAPVGPQRLAEIRREVSLPLVAIGGITIDNAADVVRAGADAVAVISAVSRAEDMEAAVRHLADAIERAKRARGSR